MKQICNSWFGLEQLGPEQLGLEQFGIEPLEKELLSMERFGMEQLGMHHFSTEQQGVLWKLFGQSQQHGCDQTQCKRTGRADMHASAAVFIYGLLNF